MKNLSGLIYIIDEKYKISFHHLSDHFIICGKLLAKHYFLLFMQS